MFLPISNFKFCHHVRNLGPGKRGSGFLQSRLARLLHHECDALESYRFFAGSLSFYCVLWNHFHPLPTRLILAISSHILTVAQVEWCFPFSFFYKSSQLISTAFPFKKHITSYTPKVSHSPQKMMIGRFLSFLGLLVTFSLGPTYRIFNHFPLPPNHLQAFPTAGHPYLQHLQSQHLACHLPSTPCRLGKRSLVYRG